MKTRVLTPELMDDPELDERSHRDALAGLARLNRVSMISRPVWRQLRALHTGEQLTILDIAAGSGDMAVNLARRAKVAGLPMRFTCADISPKACQEAQRRARRAGVGIAISTADALERQTGAMYDIVMCHLFLHHLRDHEIVKLLADMKSSARRAVLITDLVRSRTGYALAFLGSRLLTGSRIVHVDALKSVRAALSPPELLTLANAAGLTEARIQRVWPERMLMTCTTRT